MIRAGHDLRRA